MDIFALCDPGIEECGPDDSILRPGQTHLVYLNMVYFLNILLMPISIWTFFIYAARYDSNLIDDWNDLWHLLLWIVMGMWHALVWILPSLSLSIYMVFGANFFLFSWVDELALYFITSGTRSLSWKTHLMCTLIFLLQAIRNGNDIGLRMLIIYGFYALILERLAWQFGVKAARHIDPFWNEHRGLLYPESFYSYGWVQDEPYPEQGIQDPSTIINF